MEIEDLPDYVLQQATDYVSCHYCGDRSVCEWSYYDLLQVPLCSDCLQVVYDSEIR